MPDVLSREMLERIRSMALEQVALMDDLEAALNAHDDSRALDVARQLVGLEKEITKQ